MTAPGIRIAAAVSAFLLLTVSAQAQNFLVLPFENAGRDSRFDWIGDGLAELSAERLSGEGRLVFTREEWLSSLEKLGLPSSGRFSRATMIKIAEEVDADFVVFGSFTSDGKTLTATGRVLQVDPPGLSAALFETGPLDELPLIHARLAWRVLKLVDSSPVESRRSFEEAPVVPRLDAFEHYVRGLTASEERQRLRLLRESARLGGPDWAPPAFALGQAYFERRDWASALGWFSRVPLHQRNGPEAVFYAGVCHLLRNDTPRAELSFAAMVERTGAAEGHNNLGVAQARQENWSAAAAQWQKAQKLNPEEPDYWFNLGLAKLRSDDAAGALRPLREALQRRPQDTEARSLLVAALERSGRTAEAAAERQVSSLAASTTLPSPRMKTKLAGPILARGARGASTAGHRASHARLHSSRGQESLKAGRLEEAEREFSEAVLIDAQLSDAHLGLAEVYHRRGRADDAIRELRAALWAKDDARVRIALARLFREQNRLAEARAELHAALKLESANREARDLLDTIERGSKTEGRK